MINKIARFLDGRITDDTRKEIERIVGQRVHTGEKVLDLGCGETGSFNYGRLKIVCADRIKERITGKAYKRVITDADKRLPFKNKEFNTVIFSGVIQYLKNPQRAIKEINRILKPEGTLVLTTVNRNSLLRVLGLIKREPKSDAGECKMYSQQELKRLMCNSSFKILDVFGADFVWMPKELSSNLVFVAVKG